MHRKQNEAQNNHSDYVELDKKTELCHYFFRLSFHKNAFNNANGIQSRQKSKFDSERRAQCQFLKFNLNFLHNSLQNMTVEAVEADEVSKVWKITSDDFRVIQVLELNFILMF